MTSAGTPFGRDKYPLVELQSHVPRVFKYLRRCYYNRTRDQYRERLASLVDRQAVLDIYVAWARLRYSEKAIALVERRLEGPFP
jgi:hypothetical protein